MRNGFDRCKKDEIKVLEIGFGTGLNAYLTALTSDKKRLVHYTTIEKFPLSEEIWKNLNYAEVVGNRPDIFEKLHVSPWDEDIQVSPTFCLHKIQADISLLSLSGQFDVIFFDAFSPEKQAELWTEEIFKEIFKHTAKGGILTTYCAKGAVRRVMQAVGYKIERVLGPAGKREMLRATKIDD